MPEIPEALDEEIQRLAEEGGALMTSNPAQALTYFQAAWNLLPEPRSECEDAVWLLRDIGHMQFRLGQYAEGKQTLMMAIKEIPGALEEAKIRMRLGQCMLELGHQGADDWLATAYLLEGLAGFQHEDPKYVAHVKGLLAPPEGGWPEGW